jgi:universal stress protein A
MPTLNRILVPIDFSPSSQEALDYAAFLAGAVGATLEVLHVWESGGNVGPDALSVMPGAPRPAGWEQTRAELRQEVQRFIERMPPRPVAVGVRVEAGSPVEAILAAVRATGADLVVMGTHGRSGLTRLLLGSVAEEVLRRASCPVLTIRQAAARTTREAPPV